MGEAPETTLGNYIEDVNSWKLPKPPSWFLKRLFDFDAMLVIVPSRVKVKGEPPQYLLCRRRQHTAGLGDTAMLDNKHPDTNMCYMHGIIPIGPLRFKNGARTFTQRGCNSLLNDLRSRDTWQISGGPQGNADAVVDEIEYAEERQKSKERRNLRDMFYHMARDAYRSLKARTGGRNKRASDVVARTPRTPATTTPPSGQRVILTDAP